ncbi:uncharacterized protein F5891DRAFT_1194707 [Suillus fuscotomentosus]|uniref:Nephrocystin 3-like N-terminal domain-containing protein n=1 Tax=Suillus fuscotomentosus TaxID=1912939 RepID=A0AAD4DWQ7_9AGAM|nr:uncharacterized protein F5891DRAFT_1194707 [Suillus fuscotomentosus]KAG1895037.1 hypothetical protein F5891DRAFT_1194707 [Suillus fuscotomentosus]
MSNISQLMDSSPVPPDTTAVARGSSVQPPNKVHRFLSKVKDGVTKKVPRSKNLRSRDPVQDTSAVVQQGANPQSGRARPVLSPGKNGSAALDDADSIETTYLQPLRTFDTVIGTIAEVHPYAKMALGVLSCASKIILTQADRDEAVLELYKKLGQVYGFIMQDDTLLKISSMKDVLGQISRQTLECANFIRDYSEKKSFWGRLGKNIISETNDTIQQYSDVLDALMQNFRDQVTCDVATYIHDTSEILEFSGMAYAEAAGLDTRKRCLQETRIDILSDIMGWINDNRDDVPRVLWLSGPAGTGKSSIAHTIANSFIGVGGLGSCYCFDRNTEDRHKKVFITIARDLADRHPEMRRALAHAVKNQTALKTTPDVIQQWQKLVIEPLGKLSGSPVGPVVTVIDALDESGEAVETHSDILRILSGKLRDPTINLITKLPKNFRILKWQNAISAPTYQKLEGLPDFGSKDFTALAKKADNLSEWARLALSHDPVEREHLLYDMYDFILTQITPKDRHASLRSQQTQLAVFRSVMGQILGTAETLPLNSLNAMRSHFRDESEHYKVEVIVEHMGSLLSGTTNSSTPIRPLRASFHDFLTDQSHAGDFFIDVPNVQRNLAFASLGVMKDGLSFNICDLKSSYLPNSEDPGLRERVEKRIPPHLSHACRFWLSHVQAAKFDSELATE